MLFTPGHSRAASSCRRVLIDWRPASAARPRPRVSQEEWQGGQARDGDQGDDYSRGAAAGALDGPSPAPRGGPSSSETRRGPQRAPEHPPASSELGTAARRHPSGLASLGRRREGRTVVAPPDPAVEKAARTESDGARALAEREWPRSGAVGGGPVEASWPAPGRPGLAAQGRQARGQGTAGTPDQGASAEGVEALPPGAPREAPPPRRITAGAQTPRAL